MDTPSTSPAPSALARYNLATAPDGWLTATGWLDLAADLTAAIPWAFSDEAASKLRDRADDCVARAARMVAP